jgi:hypothetical protein
VPPARRMSYHKWPIPMTKSTIVGGYRLFSITIPSFLHTLSTINGYNALNRRNGRGIRVLVVTKVPSSCQAPRHERSPAFGVEGVDRGRSTPSRPEER